MPNPDILGYGTKDYGNRVGVWRMFEVMDKHELRCTVSAGLGNFEHYPEILEACEAWGVAAAVGKDKKTGVDLNQRLGVDGREMAVATARSKIELQERSGFKATPWQRRLALEQGAAPVGAAAG